MQEEYKTVYRGGEGEIVEKKSRFIATVRPVHSEEEVLAFIEEVKKKYWDARHNCFAYVIGVTNPTLRCSDDGEPAGTAGKPMLDVLTGEGLHDTAVVVTRYFGGTLLGTGGLVRAYQGAVKEGLQASTVITKRLGYRYEIGTDYTGLGKIQYILGQRQISVQDTQYTDKVLMKVILPYDQEQCVVSEITEGTNGQAESKKETAAILRRMEKKSWFLRNRTGKRTPLYRTDSPFCIGGVNVLVYRRNCRQQVLCMSLLVYWNSGSIRP